MYTCTCAHVEAGAVAKYLHDARAEACTGNSLVRGFAQQVTSAGGGVELAVRCQAHENKHHVRSAPEGPVCLPRQRTVTVACSTITAVMATLPAVGCGRENCCAPSRLHTQTTDGHQSCEALQAHTLVAAIQPAERTPWCMRTRSWRSACGVRRAACVCLPGSAAIACSTRACTEGGRCSHHRLNEADIAIRPPAPLRRAVGSAASLPSISARGLTQVLEKPPGPGSWTDCTCCARLRGGPSLEAATVRQVHPVVCNVRTKQARRCVPDFSGHAELIRISQRSYLLCRSVNQIRYFSRVSACGANGRAWCSTPCNQRCTTLVSASGTTHPRIQGPVSLAAGRPEYLQLLSAVIQQVSRAKRPASELWQRLRKSGTHLQRGCALNKRRAAGSATQLGETPSCSHGAFSLCSS